ncbi:MAG: tyrosine-type recombinase/integrase [Puniceicoccales bacterium]|jgi:integrase|nr:tyrosine-type recombinase/integrase [Puniceicoccales bacterium]
MKIVKRKDKASPSYWEERLIKPRYRKGNDIYELSNWYAVMCRDRDQRKLCLQTGDKKQAAERARDAYCLLRLEGWCAVMEKFGCGRKKVERKRDLLTVQDFLKKVEKSQLLSPRTFGVYRQAILQIMGEQLSLTAEEVRKNPLGRLSGKLLEDWKNESLRKKLSNGTNRGAAITTINTLIRNAKSLFSERMRKAIGMEKLHSPFDGLKPFKEESKRYVTKFSARDMMVDANRELKKDRPEEYKFFLLAIGCGLRRNEIDKMLWEQIDLEAGRVSIYQTPIFTPKPGAQASVPISPYIVKELAEFKKVANGQFVIESKGRAKEYRCDSISKKLNGWLHGKGIREQKPSHTLRKEYGSEICRKHGIYTASLALRHSSIATTVQHYADKTLQVTPGFVEEAAKKME